MTYTWPLYRDIEMTLGIIKLLALPFIWYVVTCEKIFASGK